MHAHDRAALLEAQIIMSTAAKLGVPPSAGGTEKRVYNYVRLGWMDAITVPCRTDPMVGASITRGDGL